MSDRFDDIPEELAGIDERLADWVDGRLGERDRERLEAELRVSPKLREQFEQYQRTVQLVQAALRAPTQPTQLADRVMARLASEAARPSRARARGWPLVFALASAAALLGVAVLVDRWGATGRGDPLQVAKADESAKNEVDATPSAAHDEDGASAVATTVTGPQDRMPAGGIESGTGAFGRLRQDVESGVGQPAPSSLAEPAQEQAKVGTVLPNGDVEMLRIGSARANEAEPAGEGAVGSRDGLVDRHVGGAKDRGEPPSPSREPIDGEVNAEVDPLRKSVRGVLEEGGLREQAERLEAPSESAPRTEHELAPTAGPRASGPAGPGVRQGNKGADKSRPPESRDDHWGALDDTKKSRGANPQVLERKAMQAPTPRLATGGERGELVQMVVVDGDVSAAGSTGEPRGARRAADSAPRDARRDYAARLALQLDQFVQEQMARPVATKVESRSRADEAAGEDDFFLGDRRAGVTDLPAPAPLRIGSIELVPLPAVSAANDGKSEPPPSRDWLVRGSQLELERLMQAIARSAAERGYRLSAGEAQVLREHVEPEAPAAAGGGAGDARPSQGKRAEPEGGGADAKAGEGEAVREIVLRFRLR